MTALNQSGKQLSSMKIVLIILSLLFLGIWVAGFFISGRGMAIHMALMISLLFFIRSLMVAKTPGTRRVDV
jgi:cytochrome c oxidase assembly factor CtaG